MAQTATEAGRWWVVILSEHLFQEDMYSPSVLFLCLGFWVFLFFLLLPDLEFPSLSELLPFPFFFGVHINENLGNSPSEGYRVPGFISWSFDIGLIHFSKLHFSHQQNGYNILLMLVMRVKEISHASQTSNTIPGV